jgi:hypothetical protein
VQQEILATHPSAKLRVYAIWTNKLLGDRRSRWDAARLTDPRVTHLWDGNDVAGDWLAGNVAGDQGGDWDTYLLFGPEATWSTGPPSPLRSSGSPVDASADTLKQAIAPLGAPSRPLPVQ